MTRLKSLEDLDLATLRGGGDYTQVPGSTPWTSRTCGHGARTFDDPTVPASGSAVFYLVAPVVDGVEGSLGDDSSGVERPNANPCP